MKGDAQTGDARFPLNGCDNIVREFDAFERPCQYERTRTDHELVCLDLFNAGSNRVPVMRVDDLVRGCVPDKMVPEPDVERVGLHEDFVIGIDLDMAPFDAVEELPVYENHCLCNGG